MFLFFFCWGGSPFFETNPYDTPLKKMEKPTTDFLVALLTAKAGSRSIVPILPAKWDAHVLGRVAFKGLPT